MEEILNRITKIEEELKKEREINRTLQFQIADMNEKIDEITNDFEKKLILSKEEFQLFLENQKSFINNIIENNNSNIEPIDYMIVDKNVFKDFALGRCSQEEFDLFMKNKDYEIIYYQENISGYNERCIFCSYIITNNNKLYGKYKYSYEDRYGNNYSVNPTFFEINISNDFFINKKLNKKYIKLFEFTIKNMINLAYLNNEGRQHGICHHHSTFTNLMNMSISSLINLY